MKKFIDRFNIEIYRNLQNGDIAFKLHSVILVLTIIFFGFMGIMPLFVVLKTKLALIQEMTDRYTTMQNNLVKLEQADVSLKKVGVSAKFLDDYMPEDTSMHKYILDFVASMGSYGYTVERFSQASSLTPSAQPEITVTLSGTSYPSDLATIIEKLKRVTQISSFGFIKGEQDEPNMINLVLVIYNYY